MLAANVELVSPYTRTKSGFNFGIKSSNYDGEQNDPEFIQWEVDILTEIFTQHDEKIDGAINELIDYKYDGVFNSRNLWSTTGDDYFVRINTKNQIIDMNINFQDIFVVAIFIFC